MIPLLLLLAIGVGQQQPIDDAIDHLNCAMGHLDRMTQILDCKDSACLEKLCPHGKCPKPKSCIPHQPQMLTQSTAPIGKSAPVSLMPPTPLTYKIQPPDKPCDPKYEYEGMTMPDKPGFAGKVLCAPIMHPLKEREYQEIMERLNKLESRTIEER